jgi:hypothetical protein
MKRGILRVALSSLLLLPLAHLSSETLFFTSDEASFPIEGIADPSLGGKDPPPEYYLKIESREGREIRSLFHKGAEIERHERETAPAPAATIERVFRSGKLSAETLYGPRGETLEERSYIATETDTSLAWRERYSYETGRLSEVERFGADDAPLGSMKYHYDPRGRLEQLDLLGWYGVSSEGSVPGEVIPRLVWSVGNEDRVLRVDRFDEEGRVATIRWLDAGTEIGTSFFQYGSTGLLEKLVHFEAASGLTTTSSYDARGRLSLDLARKDGKIVSRKEYGYDASGRLASEKKTLPPPVELHNLSYDDEGKLAREEFFLGSTLARVVIHTGEGTTTEETYAKGVVIARAFFKDGIKTHEEFLVDGKVVRERKY